MATSEERQAKALEGILTQLALLVGLQKKQLEKMVNVDRLKELRTQSGRLVGYALPNQDLVAYDTRKSGAADPTDVVPTPEQVQDAFEHFAKESPPSEPLEREKVVKILAESGNPFIVIQETIDNISTTKFRGFGVHNGQRFDVVGTVKGLVLAEDWIHEAGE